MHPPRTRSHNVLQCDPNACSGPGWNQCWNGSCSRGLGCNLLLKEALGGGVRYEFTDEPPAAFHQYLGRSVTTPKSKDREWLVYPPSTRRSHDHPDLFHRPWCPGQARCDPWPNFQHDEQSYGSGIGIGLAYTASLRRQPPCAVLTRDGPALPLSRLAPGGRVLDPFGDCGTARLVGSRLGSRPPRSI